MWSPLKQVTKTIRLITDIVHDWMCPKTVSRLQLSKFWRKWRNNKLCNLIVYELKNMITLDLILNDEITTCVARFCNEIWWSDCASQSNQHQQNDFRFHRESVNPTIWISQRQHLGLVYVKQSYLSESIYRRNLRLQQFFFVFSRFALFFLDLLKPPFSD